MEDLFGTIYDFLPLEEKYNFILKFDETKFLKQYIFDNNIIDLLIWRKRSSVLKKIINCDTKIKSYDEIFYWSIRTNETKIFEYLIIKKVNNIGILNKAFQVAVKYGRINMVKMLISRCSFSTKVINNLLEEALSRGYIEIFKYLLKVTNTFVYDNLFVRAVLHGHKKILKYLLSLPHTLLIGSEVGWAVYRAQEHGFRKAAKILSNGIVDFNNCESEFFT